MSVTTLGLCSPTNHPDEAVRRQRRALAAFVTNSLIQSGVLAISDTVIGQTLLMHEKTTQTKLLTDLVLGLPSIAFLPCEQWRTSRYSRRLIETVLAQGRQLYAVIGHTPQGELVLPAHCYTDLVATISPELNLYLTTPVTLLQEIVYANAQHA